ncbi:MAG: hypothetical protein WCC69_08315 [Pirellulales bacterium]
MRTRRIPTLEGTPVGHMFICLVMVTVTTIAIATLAMAAPESMATAITTRRALESQQHDRAMRQLLIMITTSFISTTTH